MRRLPKPDSATEEGDAALTAPRTRRGWLADLRRFSGVGTVLFALVLVVATARVHALALVVGDDDLCSAMSYASGRTAVPPSDPSDLADRHHACCDLGLCLDASALPPEAPVVAALSCRHRAPTPRRPGRSPVHRVRRRSHRPRDPPTA